MYRWGAILTGAWGFALFPLVDTGSPALITLAVTMGMIFLSMQYGPQAAYFTELFSTEVRYSGASLGYQIGAILGGALAPTIAVCSGLSSALFTCRSTFCWRRDSRCGPCPSWRRRGVGRYSLGSQGAERLGCKFIVQAPLAGPTNQGLSIRKALLYFEEAGNPIKITGSNNR